MWHLIILLMLCAACKTRDESSALNSPEDKIDLNAPWREFLKRKNSMLRLRVVQDADRRGDKLAIYHGRFSDIDNKLSDYKYYEEKHLNGCVVLGKGEDLAKDRFGVYFNGKGDQKDLFIEYNKDFGIYQSKRGGSEFRCATKVVTVADLYKMLGKKNAEGVFEFLDYEIYPGHD